MNLNSVDLKSFVNLTTENVEVSEYISLEYSLLLAVM